LDRLPLFVYGTLRDADLLAAVLGRVLKPAQVMPALAPGYQAVEMPGQVYPGLVRNRAAEAPGLLIRGIMRQEYTLLDAYEGEAYRRQRLMVMGAGRPYSAAVYLPVATPSADAPAWTLETWTRLHKSAALDTETRIARDLRLRLTAGSERT
jgi:hypothetical protein